MKPKESKRRFDATVRALSDSCCEFFAVNSDLLPTRRDVTAYYSLWCDDYPALRDVVLRRVFRRLHI